MQHNGFRKLEDVKEAWARSGQCRKEKEHTPGPGKEAARTRGQDMHSYVQRDQGFMSLNTMIWLDWEHLHSRVLY